MIIIVGLNLQVCFYQLLHDGCDLYWEYSNIIKYQYQTFILCRFLIQPLWTKRYLPGSQEAWTLTPDDEFYFHLFRLFYRTDVGKKNTHRPRRLFDASREPQGGSSDPPDCPLKASFGFWSHPQTSESIAGWCAGGLSDRFSATVCVTGVRWWLHLLTRRLSDFFLSNAAHSGSLSFIFS